MKAAFSVELIGLSASDEKLAKLAGAEREYNRRSRPWVAQLTGLTARGQFQRRFARHKADYRQANSRGTRGVRLWWTLESGRMYEACYRTGWSLTRWTHRYVTVGQDGDIIDVTESEVRQWLSAASASMS